jgi:hypothetical protein
MLNLGSLDVLHENLLKDHLSAKDHFSVIP